MPQQQYLPAAPKLNGGKLSVTVLSAYDLPDDAPPQCITLQVAGEDVGSTNPPTARHKEKNSFKYNQELKYEAPLSGFYKSSAILTVKTSNQRSLVAEFPISSLPVNESQWIILNLRSQEDSSELGAGESASSVPSDKGSSPTLRLKVCLEGPYRTEIAAFINLLNSWFNLMDGISANLPTIHINVKEIPKQYPILKFFLVPVVPVSGLVVALLPILIGILVVGLPFFLPFLVVLAGFVASIVGVGAIVYFSLPEGRKKVLDIVHPATSALVSTPVGQRLVYDTGARPSPKTLAKFVLPGSQDIMAKLLVSLAIDFIGSCSYLLPGVGEAFDLAWAPAQTILISAMYDDTTPSLKYISFIEEILPFTDFVPSATIGWTKEYSPILLNFGQQKIHEIIVATRREKHVAFAK